MRQGLRPNGGGEIPAHAVARNRRTFRMSIAPYVEDSWLADREAEMRARIRWIEDGNLASARVCELKAHLYAIVNEIKRRGQEKNLGGAGDHEHT